jgi:hypothetical protein
MATTPTQARIKRATDLRSGGEVVDIANPLPVVVSGFSEGEPGIVDGRVDIKGSRLIEQLTQDFAIDGELTFAADIDYIHAYNRDAAADLLLGFGPVVVTVPPMTTFGPVKIVGFEGATVSVVGSATFIVTRCE